MYVTMLNCIHLELSAKNGKIDRENIENLNYT